MAHALAKDAINSKIDEIGLEEGLKTLGLNTVSVQSQIQDANEYLKNPAKGRVLNEESLLKLEGLNEKNADLCIILADGLSANAVNIHSINLLKLLIQQLKGWTIAPIVLAKYSRVALSDQIGEVLKSRIALILIGERPGLSSPNSMGAYLTYHPKTGNTDEKRNCVSNIQPEGLNYELAAIKIAYLLQEMRSKRISGVQLKDEHNDTYLK